AVSPALERAILRALARSPADRFQTSGEFVAALEAAASHDGDAEPSRRTASRPRAWRRHIVTALGAVAAALIVWIVMLRQRPSSQPLDQRLIAIAPFDVLDPALALWRQGFVDVLAANLDGAGAFRTVSPSLILRRWTGPSDRALAARVARSAGAAISIFGRLESVGADSVRCTVWIDDAGSGERLGELAMRESGDRMDRLGDSLSIGILRELGFSGVAGSTRLSSLGSHSLPAIKLYLQGEQLFRRASFDSARPVYERAIAADSTFGLAMNRLASVLSWQGVAYDAEATRLMLAASRYVAGLSPRDSMHLTADALWARLLMFEPDSAWWTKGQVLLRTLTDMNTRSPGDVAVWNLMGETYFHLGGALGTSWVAARDAFDRAIAIDSQFGPAWVHPIGIALGTDSLEAARRYAQGLYERRARASREDWVSVVRDILAGTLTDPAELERRLTALPLEGIFEIWAATSKWVDSAETAIRVARAFARARPSGRSTFNDPVLRAGFLLRSLIDRGHFAEALGTGSSDLEAELPYLVAMGVISADSANSVFDEWVRTGNRSAHLALEWLASRGDVAAISRYRERARLRSQSAVGADRHFAAFEMRAADAYTALAQHDSARAVSALLALPDSLCPTCHAHRLTLGRLLLATGRNGQADSILSQDPTSLHLRSPAAEFQWRVERGRAAEQAGQRTRAIAAYELSQRSYAFGDSIARALSEALGRQVAALRRGNTR
ncbi:MAG: hypothetical protein AB1762_10850, partial [Gemmatimonadota bacterium]